MSLQLKILQKESITGTRTYAEMSVSCAYRLMKRLAKHGVLSPKQAIGTDTR